MIKKSTLTIVAVLAAILSTSIVGSALSISSGRFVQIAHLMGGEYSQGFGASVALEGDTLAVGDPYDNQYGEKSGAVTIFQPDDSGQWSAITRIMPNDTEPGMLFGRNLALSGDLLVAGAPYDLDNPDKPGIAYIFERNQGGPNAWGQIARLVASEIYPHDNFGWAVGLDGNTAAAGAYSNPLGGRVYIFERNAGGQGMWGEVAQLSPDPPGYGASFGESLDLDGGLLAIGAYAGGDYAGYIYIFQQRANIGDWQRLTRFRAADTAAYHFFGYSLALDGWTVLAGAPGADELTGAAYIFTAEPAQPDVWSEQARLSASDGAKGDYFAIELDLSGSKALVGTPIHSNSTGAAYAYDRDYGGSNHWGEISHLTANDSVPGDQFGYWTSISGNLTAVGAPGNLPTGSAYLFDFSLPWQVHLPWVAKQLAQPPAQ